MSLDNAASKPHERMAQYLADDLSAVGDLITQRMASKHAPRIPEVTAHLVDAGGKRLRQMLTLACALYFRGGLWGLWSRWVEAPWFPTRRRLIRLEGDRP